jgi:hypothetical protein
MDSKWPFMLIVFGLIFALGLIIASLERTGVMNNWDKRRCELPVTITARFFKPDSDPRTKDDFAKDNFNFCMKTYIDKFMGILMAPINVLFGKHVNLAGDALGMVDTIRKIAASMYNALLGFLDTYYRKFNASVYEISRVIQFLRMAMRRANAVVISMLYSGITLFRGLLNTIQFVIKVVLIICSIMLAIIIILFFILFPFIPIILSALGAIIATVMALVMVISGEVASEASSKRSGFCFSNWTMVATLDKYGKELYKPVSELKIGDELAKECGKITTIIQMDGTEIPLYYLNGIMVSGSHLVKGTDGQWKSVSQDKRAIETNIESPILYCFNTTSHNIPVYSKYNEIILFRDWEEIEDDDEKGHYEWNYIILKMLNNFSNYNLWKDSLQLTKNIPLMSSNTLVKTDYGFLPISELLESIGINFVVDSKGNKQKMLGTVRGEVEDVDIVKMKELEVWNTELYEMENGIWIKGKSRIISGNDRIEGMTIITESGEFIIWDQMEKREKIIRDFTEIGYKTIHKTYPFVASRLRTNDTKII